MMWRYPGAWSGNFHGLGGIGMGLGLIVNILVIVGVIYLVVRLFRGGFGCYGHHQGIGYHAPGGPEQRANSQEAVNIVNRRYASGEITREEYHQVMEDLKKYGEGNYQTN